MDKTVETINLDTDLRRHLLFGFIGLVIAVLIVFINVAYHIASDVGESIESEYTQVEINEISSVIKGFVTTGDLGNSELNQQFMWYFSGHHYFIDDYVVLFNIWVAGKEHIISENNDFELNSDIKEALFNKVSNKGFIEINGVSFFWLYQHNVNDKIELLFVRKAYSLDHALASMTTRLSISAFITFWFAVWIALVVSALITKRFIKGNIRLNYLANHDTLTKLPNRSYLNNITDRYFKRKSPKPPLLVESKSQASVLLIDLNKFKAVNDTMGHHMGDMLLTLMASRLNKFVDESTHACRYGGDEFIIWKENSSQGAAERLAEEIIQVCRKPLHIGGSKFEMSVSIGIANYPEDGQNLNNLFKHADMAMYHAKRLRLGYQSYQQSLDSRSSLRVNLSGQLNHALTNDQFVLYYQPKVTISDGKIFGVEALVRWQHPIEGLLGPGVFIDIIEQSDFVHAFTRYVFKQAILQCKRWLDQNLYLSVAVNISPYNLLDSGLIAFLQEQLTYHQVPAELIEIELTESATMVDIDVTQKVFKQFKDIGVKLSIDDFGTGMSSLAYIKQLEVDYIKIDRSFIINIDKDIADEAIVMSILLLCQKLNREVIIEGIETQEQKDKLISLGCKLAQGYYFGKPMPAELLTPRLREIEKIHI